MNQFRKTLFLFCAVVAFLVLTVPANHSEAEDTYYYARMVEQGAWGEMFHQHHLLYLPVARLFFRLLQMFGFAGRALPVLIGLSIVSAAAVICFFAAMLQQNGQRRWWVLPLLFSYGFWRYACAAEIYLPALALACAVWFFASRPKRGGWAVVCAVFSLLLHLVCLPAVFAAGLLFAGRKEWKMAGLFYLNVGFAIAAAYGLILATVGTVVFRDTDVLPSSLLNASTWLKGLFAFGHNLLSGNFLFSIPVVAGKLVELFPYQMLQEELFMGRQAGTVWQTASVITFLGALIPLGIAGFGLIRFRSAWRCPMAVWLAGNVAMALLFEPANPEMWIFTLLPFWFLVSNAWTRCEAKEALPCCGGATAEESGKQVESASGKFSKGWKWVLPVLAAAMFLHNAIGGMAFVRSPAGDYCRRKAAWILKNVADSDVVVSADSHSFVTYLQYYCLADVLDAKFQTLGESPWSGRVFVYDDVLNPLPAVLNRDPGSVARLRAFGKRLCSGLVLVHVEGEWMVYERIP